MTLAFELAALQRLADPAAAIADATEWSEHLGVISEAPTYVVTSFARSQGVDLDFFSGPRDRTTSLQTIAHQFETDRYVFVGTEESDRDIVTDLPWEFQHIDDAATAANWECADNAASQSRSFADPPATDGPQHDDWP